MRKSKCEHVSKDGIQAQEPLTQKLKWALWAKEIFCKPYEWSRRVSGRHCLGTGTLATF